MNTVSEDISYIATVNNNVQFGMTSGRLTLAMQLLISEFALLLLFKGFGYFWDKVAKLLAAIYPLNANKHLTFKAPMVQPPCLSPTCWQKNA